MSLFLSCLTVECDEIFLTLNILCKQQNLIRTHHNDPVRPGTVHRGTEPLPGFVVELTSGSVVVA